MPRFIQTMLVYALGTTLFFVGVYRLGFSATNDTVPMMIITLIGVVLIAPERAQDILSACRALWSFMPGSDLSDAPKEDKTEEREIKERAEQNSDILGADQTPTPVEEWYSKLRPLLYQASQYTVPTYYLDATLHVIDWNVTFSVLFVDLVSEIRGKHVNWLIAQLSNRDEVFDHARMFTKRVRDDKELLFADSELLKYRSHIYGDVTLLKIATQLHDSHGELAGWTVCLVPRTIDWGQFHRDGMAAIGDNKLWSVYAASYDRILQRFPAYQTLINDVIAPILKKPDAIVADLGAGTGNVTSALVVSGHRVISVEKNMSMLDQLRAKTASAPPGYVTILRAGVEHLGPLKDASCNAAVMVNVLYAVDDPPACLNQVYRILTPGGLLCYSTTRSGHSLETLLLEIKNTIVALSDYNSIEEDLENVLRVNRALEKTIASRYSKEQYLEWTKNAGFEIINVNESAYHDAVMVVHARKR